MEKFKDTLCKFCKKPESIRQWRIGESDHWIVYLHPNQVYLGRCFVVLKRHLEDFFDINSSELEDFFRTIKVLRNIQTKLFQPDLFNYAILGNDVAHVHLNFVPRYSRPVTYQGFVFEDKRWGQNYSPYDKAYAVPEEIFGSLLKDLRAKMSEK